VGPSDAELIRRAGKDPDALAQLYVRYRPQLYAWFRARLPEVEASELTAELFAQVALSLRRFRDEAGGSAGPGLYGIARNLMRRYHQQGRLETAARKQLGMPIRSYELETEEVERRLDATELRPRLAYARNGLPPEQRDAVELRVIEERSYDEVAAVLGCTETAARIRVMRALGKLARALAGA
jgi:RNA polymerase sigma factor (sigma-70 family)